VSSNAISAASAIAAYQSTSLTNLRHVFDTISIDLDQVLAREVVVAAGIDDIETELARSRALLHRLGVTPHARADLTMSVETRRERVTRAVPMVPSETDFERLTTLARSHLELMGVDLERDPMLQVVPGLQVAAGLDQYAREHGDVSWTETDWVVVLGAGVIASILDIALVRIPQDTNFLGKQQSGSPLTKWLKDDERAAAIHERFFQRLEKAAKVSFDAPHTAATFGVVSNMSPKTHRLQSLSHDPVLGFVFGIADSMRGTGTYVDGSGVIRVVSTNYDRLGLGEAITKQVLHLLSDWYTKAGVPSPFMGLLQIGDVSSPFVLGRSGEAVSWTNVSRYMYTHGYDLRHFFTMGIVPGTIEAIIRGYWLLDGIASGKSAEQRKLEKAKLASMLLLAHTIATSGTLVKTGLIYGMNPLALNQAQIMAIGPAALAWIKESVARERRISEALADEWRSLLSESEGLAPPDSRAQ
jgi:hypothetical protein